MKKKCVQDGQGKVTNENFPDMSGGGGMGSRVPPSDTSETEERDEDKIVHASIKWSKTKGNKGGIDKMQSFDVSNDKRLPKSSLKKGVSESKEQFLDRVKTQHLKIKKMCTEQYPEDRRQRKQCIGVHKAKWIRANERK